MHSAVYGIKENELLSNHTTIRIGGPARYFHRPSTLSELRNALAFARDRGLDIYVITGGSDIIFPDRGYDGLVLRLDRIRGLERVGEDTIMAYAGEPLPSVAIATEKWGLSGFEHLFGVPGRIGGAIAKNAGAYGLEIRDMLEAVEVVTWDGEVVRLRAQEIGIRYRESDVLNYGIVYRAWFRLKEDEPEAIRQRRESFSRRRMKSQPYGVATAGCMFKNPPGNSAGKLLDMAGMKGERKGDIMVSHKHANFFINLGEGRSEDVLHLLELARKRVYEEFGIQLEEEVVILK